MDELLDEAQRKAEIQCAVSASESLKAIRYDLSRIRRWAEFSFYALVLIAIFLGLRR